jgi:2-polyprenyl-6-methoxyphenol hydroxylase-like FAD-dependent oxidoreductase
MTHYDLLIAGGGLAGSALAIVMAQRRARVLVVERESDFRDRIRGEFTMPWGSVEAKALGLYDDLLQRCGVEVRHWQTYVNGQDMPRRDLKATTPGGTCMLNFPHPAMQETLIERARAAGAEIWRGAAVEGIEPGAPPRARVRRAGRSHAFTARLVVAADGRESKLRSAAGFVAKHDPEQLYIAGMLLAGKIELESAVHFMLDADHGRAAILAAIAPDLARIYLVHHKDALPRRLSGARDVGAAFDQFRAIGVRADWLAATRQSGPFASFDGRHRWVERPYRDGVVLIGDAAAASDPSWGNGLSRTLRDVRLLRDRLLADDDWDRAAAAYAADHDDFYGRLHRLESMMADLYLEMGPEADRRRRRAFALFAQDETRSPDTIGLGPEAPSDEAARRRFFGEV